MLANWQFCCVDVYRSESLLAPKVVQHVHRIRINIRRSHYKLRIKYAKCHFSQDNVIESSDPSNVFSVKMCLSFTFRVSTNIHFPIKQINICLLHSVSVFERFQCISAIWLVLPPFKVLRGLCLVRDGLSLMRL